VFKCNSFSPSASRSKPGEASTPTPVEEKNGDGTDGEESG